MGLTLPSVGSNKYCYTMYVPLRFRLICQIYFVAIVVVCTICCMRCRFSRLSFGCVSFGCLFRITSRGVSSNRCFAWSLLYVSRYQ